MATQYQTTDLLTPPNSGSPTSSPSRSPPLDAVTDASPVHSLVTLRRHKIRSVLMRAGTSKGLFFRLSDLPADRDQWEEVILGAMGSPDVNLKQLGGMGGGVSTMSKVAVISPSEDPRADVDYLFIQVPVNGTKLDYSGNCGNMSAGVGPFALEEGMIVAPGDGEGQMTVRIRNVNTDRIIHSQFSVSSGLPVEDGPLFLDGVGQPGSPLRLDFMDPAGSMTGKLLPTGSPTDQVNILVGSTPKTFTVSAIDAANPFIFVQRSDLGLTGEEGVDEVYERTASTLMEIRAHMAIKMGLATSLAAAHAVQGTPKIAIVGPASPYTTSSGRVVAADETDIWARPFSMGRPHPSIQMTGAVCFAGAAAVPGTIVFDLVQNRASKDVLRIGHASGVMSTDSEVQIKGGEVELVRGSVYRTARRLMEGTVYYLGK